jgi:hypothetical protein
MAYGGSYQFRKPAMANPTGIPALEGSPLSPIHRHSAIDDLCVLLALPLWLTGNFLGARESTANRFARLRDAADTSLPLKAVLGAAILLGPPLIAVAIDKLFGLGDYGAPLLLPCMLVIPYLLQAILPRRTMGIPRLSAYWMSPYSSSEDPSEKPYHEPFTLIGPAAQATLLLWRVLISTAIFQLIGGVVCAMLNIQHGLVEHAAPTATVAPPSATADPGGFDRFFSFWSGAALAGPVGFVIGLIWELSDDERRAKASRRDLVGIALILAALLIGAAIMTMVSHSRQSE